MSSREQLRQPFRIGRVALNILKSHGIIVSEIKQTAFHSDCYRYPIEVGYVEYRVSFTSKPYKYKGEIVCGNGSYSDCTISVFIPNFIHELYCKQAKDFNKYVSRRTRLIDYLIYTAIDNFKDRYYIMEDTIKGGRYGDKHECHNIESYDANALKEEWFTSFLDNNAFIINNTNVSRLTDIIYRIYKDIKGLEAFYELVEYIDRKDEVCKYEPATAWDIIVKLINLLNK